MAELNFNATSVAPSTGTQDPLPAGWYIAAIIKSELKPTGTGTGAFLELVFDVLDGQHKGKKVYSRLNLKNANAQAVEIAYRDLSAICHAVQVMQVGDSSMLHNRPLKIKVSLRPAREETVAGPNGEQVKTGKVYEASNEIKAYRNVNEPTDMAAATAPAGYGAPAAQQYAPPPAQHQPPAQNWGAPAQPTAYQPPAQPQQPPAQAQAPAYGAPAAQPWAQPLAQPQAQQPQAPQQAMQPPAQPWAQQPPAGAPQFQQPQQPVQPPAAAAPAPWAPPPVSSGGAVPPWQQQ